MNIISCYFSSFTEITVRNQLFTALIPKYEVN